MLKIRREWRRTSSSQAEPSPWRHCWTSWASCSNVSSASNPGTVTCVTTLGQFLVNRGQPISACHTMERKVPLKCSLGHRNRGGKNPRILLIRREKHNECPRSRPRRGAACCAPARQHVTVSARFPPFFPVKLSLRSKSTLHFTDDHSIASCPVSGAVETDLARRQAHVHRRDLRSQMN